MMSNIPLFTGIGDPKATGYSFDLGSIRDSKYGTAENLTGIFKYVSYPGVYKRSPYLDNPKQLDKIVLDLLPNGRELFPDDLDEDVLKKMRDFTLATALTFPFEQMEDPKLKGLTLYVATVYSVDDACEMLLQDDNGKSDSYYKEFRHAFQEIYDMLILKCSDSEIEALIKQKFPSFLEKVDSFMKAALQVKERTIGSTQENVFKLHLDRPALVDSLQESISANILYAEFRRTGKHYKSLEAMYAIFRSVSGARNSVETSIFLFDQSVNPSVNVRKDILFQAALINIDLMIVCSNAILGLSRDIAKGNEDGPLMYLVAYKQWPLQKAFDEVYGRYQDAFDDYMLNRAKLVEVYSDDKDVLKYIEAMEYFLNGMLNGYKIGERYGCEKNMEIVFSNES